MTNKTIRDICDREFWARMKGIIEEVAHSVDRSTVDRLLYGGWTDIFAPPVYGKSPVELLVGPPCNITWIDDDDGEIHVLEGR